MGGLYETINSLHGEISTSYALSGKTDPIFKEVARIQDEHNKHLSNEMVRIKREHNEKLSKEMADTISKDLPDPGKGCCIVM